MSIVFRLQRGCFVKKEHPHELFRLVEKGHVRLFTLLYEFAFFMLLTVYFHNHLLFSICYFHSKILKNWHNFEHNLNKKPALLATYYATFTSTIDKSLAAL